MGDRVRLLLNRGEQVGDVDFLQTLDITHLAPDDMPLKVDEANQVEMRVGKRLVDQIGHFIFGVVVLNVLVGVVPGGPVVGRVRDAL